MIRRLSALYQRYGTAFWIVLVGGFIALFLLRERGEAEEIWTVLTSGHPIWIVLIAACYIGTLVVTALTYQVVLRRLRHQIPLLPLTEIHLKRQLVGTVTPVGGPASVYVLVRSLGQRGVAASDALITATLKSVTSAVAFIAILAPALLLHQPSPLILGATVGLVVFLLALLPITILLLTGMLLPAKIEARVPSRIRTFVGEMRDRNLGIKDLGLPLLFGFTGHLINTGMLYLGLQAVGYEASLSTVLVGYGIGNLFLMIAPVFQGIGIVEVTMAIALGQTGVPPIAAAGATLLFRFGDLWFPFGLALMVQTTRRLAGWSTVVDRIPVPQLTHVGAQRGRLRLLEPAIMPSAYSYALVILVAGLPSGIATWASLCGAFASTAV